MGLLDCLYNRNIPKSTDEVVVVRPFQDRTFVNGLALQFDEDSYDSALNQNISEVQFK